MAHETFYCVTLSYRIAARCAALPHTCACRYHLPAPRITTLSRCRTAPPPVPAAAFLPLHHAHTLCHAPHRVPACLRLRLPATLPPPAAAFCLPRTATRMPATCAHRALPGLPACSAMPLALLDQVVRTRTLYATRAARGCAARVTTTPCVRIRALRAAHARFCRTAYACVSALPLLLSRHNRLLLRIAARFAAYARARFAVFTVRYAAAPRIAVPACAATIVRL